MKKVISCIMLCMSALLQATASDIVSGAPIDPLVEETINRYLHEVVITKEQLPLFFKDIFSTNFYVERFLPSCFVHFDDFLRFGSERKKPCAFVSTTCALFTQRLTACTWVNPYALLDFLEKVPERLHYHVSSCEAHEAREVIKKELKNALLNCFDELKNEPEKFLDETAKKIDEALVEVANPLGLREMQARLTLFLLVAFSKLIWNPREKLDVWNLMTALASKLQNLYDARLIANYDDLNMLLWALIYRFGYFIDCAGSQIPSSSYKNMQSELLTRKHLVFALAEPESSLITKEAYLEQIVIQGLSRSEAYEKGIFVSGLI